MISTALNKILILILFFASCLQAQWSINNSVSNAYNQKIGSSLSWLPMISTVQKDRFTSQSMGTVIISYDQGNTWAKSAGFPGDVEMTSAVGTADGNYFVVGIHSSDQTVVYGSYNSGRTFEPVHTTVCIRNSNSLFGTLKVSQKGKLVLAGVCNNELVIKSSSDQGKTWQLISKFTPGPGLHRFVNQSFDLSSNDEVYILDGNGNTFKYPLNDPSPSWSLFSAGSQISLTQKIQTVLPSGILVGQDDAVYIYGKYYFPQSTNINFLKFTNDQGATWKTVNLNELDKNLTKMGYSLGVSAMARSSRGKLYMGVTAEKAVSLDPSQTITKGLMFVSSDSGATWIQDIGFEKLNVSAVTDLHLNADEVVFVNAYRVDMNSVRTALTIKQTH